MQLSKAVKSARHAACGIAPAPRICSGALAAAAPPLTGAARSLSRQKTAGSFHCLPLFVGDRAYLRACFFTLFAAMNAMRLMTIEMTEAMISILSAPPANASTSSSTLRIKSTRRISHAPPIFEASFAAARRRGRNQTHGRAAPGRGAALNGRDHIENA